MSLTARDIVKGAMKKIAVLAAGREPTGDQAADALEALQSLYLELVGQGVFGRLIPTLVTDATYEAHEYERVVCDGSDTTVTLPDEITQEWCQSGGPVDGPSDYGWSFSSSAAYPRPPRDSAVIQIAKTDTHATLTYIYDAPQAQWVALESLTLDSAAPLGDRHGEALKAMLAVRIAPNFGIEASATVIGQANTGKYQLSAKADRISRRDVGEYY